MNMCLRGIPMLAEEALNAGLVSEVVLPENLQERGLVIARELATLSPSAYEVIKESMHRALSSDMDSEWTANLPNQALLLSSEDFETRLRAVQKKRP